MEGQLKPDGLRPSDLLAVLHLSHLTPLLRAHNATLLGTSGITLGFWTVTMDSTESGTWVFTQTDIVWSEAYSTTAGGGVSRLVPIAVPAVLGSFMVVCALTVGWWLFLVRHRRRRQCGGGKGPDGSQCAMALDGNSGGGGSGGGPLGRAAADGGYPDFQKPLAGSGSLAMAALPPASPPTPPQQASPLAIPPGAESDAAVALAAVLVAANKMLSSNNESTASASVDASGAVVTAAAVALAAAYERARSEKALGTGAQAATSSVPAAPDTR